MNQRYVLLGMVCLFAIYAAADGMIKTMNGSSTDTISVPSINTTSVKITTTIDAGALTIVKYLISPESVHPHEQVKIYTRVKNVNSSGVIALVESPDRTKYTVKLDCVGNDCYGIFNETGVPGEYAMTIVTSGSGWSINQLEIGGFSVVPLETSEGLNEKTTTTVATVQMVGLTTLETSIPTTTSMVVTSSTIETEKEGAPKITGRVVLQILKRPETP